MTAVSASQSFPDLPLTSRLIFESRDLLAARNHLSRFLWKHSVIPIDRRPRVAFRHCAANVGSVSINALHYGTAVKIDAVPDDSYLFLVLLRGDGMFSQDGFSGPVGPEIVRTMNPTGRAQMRFSPGEANLTLRIPAAVLLEFLERETGVPVTAPLVFEPEANPNDADAPGLRRYLEFVCREIDRQSRPSMTDLVARQMERTIVSLALTQLPHNYSDALGGAPLGEAPEHVRIVEDYIRGHADDPLSLNDLAEIAGVSARTLQTGFRRYRETTPMEYMRDYRLDLARHALKNAAATGRSVTDIAQSCGFNHPGKFAKCYRARFGETPSDTRKRSLSSIRIAD
jgi:AraC-like DNA-binding protein